MPAGMRTDSPADSEAQASEKDTEWLQIQPDVDDAETKSKYTNSRNNIQERRGRDAIFHIDKSVSPSQCAFHDEEQARHWLAQ